MNCAFRKQECFTKGGNDIFPLFQWRGKMSSVDEIHKMRKKLFYSGYYSNADTILQCSADSIRKIKRYIYVSKSGEKS
ncbi:MAG TPA: hypothetical protein DCO72_08005 [Ruminococcus sp.]|nr:hypothetical protein [Ruminococcus sp.]